MVAPSGESEYPWDFGLVEARRIAEELEKWFPWLDVEDEGRALIVADLVKATDQDKGPLLTAAADAVWQWIRSRASTSS